MIFRTLSDDETYTDSAFTKQTLASSNDLFATKVHPNMLINRRVGNMYTASLYAQLVTFISRYY